MNEPLLTTVKQIRTELGLEVFAYFRQISGTIEERNKTRAIRRDFPANRRWCAACGESPPCGLHFHHIVHVAAGGKSDTDNLILLCGRCHTLVHQGLAQAKTLRSASLSNHDSRSRNSEIYDEMSNVLRQCHNVDPVQWFIDDGQYSKALELATSGNDLASRIRTIEIQRRRCADGALEYAADLWQKLKEGPSLSWYWYEGGYIALLLGHPDLALKRFRKALDIDSYTDPSEERKGAWLASAGLVVQCLIATRNNGSNWTELDALVNHAHKVIEGSPRGTDDVTRKRWVDNWRWHDVRIWLVRGDKQRCLTALCKARKEADKNTADTKHDRLGLAVRLSIEGAVAAHWAQTNEEWDGALRTLALALLLQIGLKRRNPEMVRDVLYSMSHCLRKKDGADEELASRIASIASRTRDGSSWLYPFIASS